MVSARRRWSRRAERILEKARQPLIERYFLAAVRFHKMAQADQAGAERMSGRTGVVSPTSNLSGRKGAGPGAPGRFRLTSWNFSPPRNSPTNIIRVLFLQAIFICHFYMQSAITKPCQWHRSSSTIIMVRWASEVRQLN
jgi:hypothetical protein